jgi:hypothetical protein
LIASSLEPHPLPRLPIQYPQDFRSLPSYQSLRDSIRVILALNLHRLFEQFHIEVLNLQHPHFLIHFAPIIIRYRFLCRGRS